MPMACQMYNSSNQNTAYRRVQWQSATLSAIMGISVRRCWNDL